MTVRTDDIDSLVMDLAVAANGAHRGGLRDPDAAVRLAADAIDTGTELEVTAAPDDDGPRLMHEAGRLLATLANKTKVARLRRARVKSDADELLKIKSVSEPPKPTQAELSAALDAIVMNQAAPFSVNDYEADEAKRVEAQNAALEAQNRRHEEQRAQQVSPDTGAPWRR